MRLYTLGLPNREVQVGLMRSLLPSYVMPDTLKTTTMITYLSRDIIRGEMEAALCRLQEFLGTVPYAENTHYEGHYQQMFYVIFSLLGMYVDVEVRTPRPPRPCGCGTSHARYAVCHRTEAGQECRSGDAADRPEELSRTLCAVWVAGC